MDEIKGRGGMRGWHRHCSCGDEAAMLGGGVSGLAVADYHLPTPVNFLAQGTF